MFFPERIKSIKATDKVLEIGPGGTPHPRSDVLLEKIFNEPCEAKEQRGNTPELSTNKKIVFYQGDNLPFADNEFDYTICSHVLEHVDNVEKLISELTRVSSKGYMEYPTIYYEYLYNFRVHKNLIHNKDNIIYWMKKSDTKLNEFAAVQDFFYQTLTSDYFEMIETYKSYFFEGYEWFDTIISKEVDDIALLCLNPEQFKGEVLKEVNKKKSGLIDKLFHWLRG
jgi:ubiquinone/menaquinone biosynthesis C-methylase UbiE